jgi:DNA modification methylase
MAKDVQEIEKAKGKPMLVWAGKKPLEKVEYYPAQEKEFYGDKTAKEFNKLFWGDNLQVLAHLLKEYRGKIDLIYIDPPFDSKADYAKKVAIRGEKIEGQQKSFLEEKQYSDMWEKDEYLQFMYERLLIIKELLSDKGIFILHADWHKGAYLRLISDEVFGEGNFLNEIVWHYFMGGKSKDFYARKHDNLIVYKNRIGRLNIKITERILPYKPNLIDENSTIKEYKCIETGSQEKRDFYTSEVREDDVWDISGVFNMGKEDLRYPTQKPEILLEKIIRASTNEGDLVLDCFAGSGTTMAVAQKLGRRWIGCDINLGAIQTTIKRLNGILDEQKKDKKGFSAFKVYNVNDYDIFKNELEAKDIIMEMYGVEPIKRSYFDGLLDNNYVKVMPLNRVLNKLDLKTVIKNTEDKLGDFTAKKTSKTNEAIFEEGVLVICSGMEIDVLDFLKRENKTGVKVEVRDILTNKQNLIFKQKPEAKIKLTKKGAKITLKIEEFYSPILIRKLELENQKKLKDEYKAKVEDFRQIIDSVAIDIDYNDKLFNAEIMDLPSKKEIIKGEYEWDGKENSKVAIKIVDVLGEEYFEVLG